METSTQIVNEYIRITEKHIKEYGAEKVFTDKYLNVVIDRIMTMFPHKAVESSILFKDWFEEEKAKVSE